MCVFVCVCCTEGQRLSAVWHGACTTHSMAVVQGCQMYAASLHFLSCLIISYQFITQFCMMLLDVSLLFIIACQAMVSIPDSGSGLSSNTVRNSDRIYSREYVDEIRSACNRYDLCWLIVAHCLIAVGLCFWAHTSPMGGPSQPIQNSFFSFEVLMFWLHLNYVINVV